MKCQKCPKGTVEYSARKQKDGIPTRVCTKCADKLKLEGYVIVTY